MINGFTNVGVELYKYEHSKVYKIKSLHTDKVYIGSTIQSLKNRLCGHLVKYKRYQNGKSKNKMSSFQLFDLGDYDIELIEEYPCNNRAELLKREGYWIRNNNCVNRCIVGRTRKQYRSDNREQLSQKRKQHYNNNKELILQKKKEYFIKNKEQISQKKKQYRIKNKDIISQQRKHHYNNNKEQI